MTGSPRRFDLRLWVTVDPPGPALAAFFADVVELARRHPGIEVGSVSGRDRPRVHVPPRFNNDAGERSAERSSRS
jgi:hypothetical protein